VRGRRDVEVGPDAVVPDAGSARRPLSAVLAAFEGGCGSFAEVATRCDLPLDTVRACVDHLVRMGRLEARELAVGCPSGGCGSCASAAGDASGAGAAAGCGASGPPAHQSGPVLVSISVPRR